MVVPTETKVFPADLVEKEMRAQETRQMPASLPNPHSTPTPPTGQVTTPTGVQPGGGLSPARQVLRRSIVPAEAAPIPEVSALASYPQPLRAPQLSQHPPASPDYQAPAATTSALAPSAKKKSVNSLVVALVFLSVLAAASLGTTIFLLTRSGHLSLDGIPGFSADEGNTESGLQEEVMFPAPEGTGNISDVISPSENIACKLGDTGAVCTIFENNYLYYGVPSCGEGLTTLRVDESGAGLACSTPAVTGEGSKELPYGSSTTVGSFVCLSREDGMNCWNTITGDSFILARDGWTSGDSGQVPEEEVSWY